mmetsp:Transcript_104148/g.324751  ORF Transcript_104148/g.324751 Transcript_104148/m.324751 type:complete len:253 (-) Transcript_104148:428-1186(-)
MDTAAARRGDLPRARLQAAPSGRDPHRELAALHADVQAAARGEAPQLRHRQQQLRERPDDRGVQLALHAARPMLRLQRLAEHVLRERGFPAQLAGSAGGREEAIAQLIQLHGHNGTDLLRPQRREVGHTVEPAKELRAHVLAHVREHDPLHILRGDALLLARRRRWCLQRSRRSRSGPLPRFEVMTKRTCLHQCFAPRPSTRYPSSKAGRKRSTTSSWAFSTSSSSTTAPPEPCLFSRCRKPVRVPPLLESA